MRLVALVIMITGTASGVAALALLMAGLWEYATYALIGAGGLLILGSFTGMIAAGRDRAGHA
jgi:hypothetical protein